jgi:hypothetical protein
MVTGYLCKVIPAAEARKPPQGLNTMPVKQEVATVDRVWMQRGASYGHCEGSPFM